MNSALFWRALYRAALLLAWPWVQVRLRLRARTEPEYGVRIAERFGRVPVEVPRGAIWFHSVSAGETIAAAPLIAALADAFPDLPFLVTTMTPTGSAQVRQRLGSRVAHCYAPYDFPQAVRRFYDRVEPRLLVLMETELWPNLLAQAKARDIPAMLVNARLSERSARGYGRIGGLTRSMLGDLTRIACQYPDHAARFRQLGADPARIEVLGNVKFDVTLPADHAARITALRAGWRLEHRPVWIAASTHEGEESLALEAHRLLRARFSDAVLILVPRHPSRAGSVAAAVEAADLNCVRTSAETSAFPEGRTDPVSDAATAEDAPVAVVLGDRMGELLYLYGLADIALLGGSLVPVGGHNPIEAAVCGLPMLMGPHRFNFTDVALAFEAADCLHQVNDAESIAGALIDCFGQPERARKEGARARQVVAENAGATERLRSLLTAQIRSVTG